MGFFCKYFFIMRKTLVFFFSKKKVRETKFTDPRAWSEMDEDGFIRP